MNRDFVELLSTFNEHGVEYLVIGAHALADDRARVSTIDLRIDYLRPGKQEALRAHATLVRAGKTVGVADVRMFHPSDESETIATGKGVHAIRLGKPYI